MQLIAALIYWVIVVLWLGVLGTVLFYYIRNPQIFGTARLLLLVVALDTCRNIIENTYFGLLFGSQYGLFPKPIAGVLGNPILLIIPKLTNIAAGCFVIVVLLMRWLPSAVRERGQSARLAAGLELLATTDGLTSVFNHRHFQTLASAEWQRFTRYGRPLSLLSLDVDHFKTINDRFGHDAGDLVLKAIAADCSSAGRGTDIVARVGGEEFALLLPETNEAAAGIVAERLRSIIESHSKIFPGRDTQISVSIGVVSATLDMPNFEFMLKRADEALYEAKRRGRNQVVTAPRQMRGEYHLDAKSRISIPYLRSLFDRTGNEQMKILLVEDNPGDIRLTLEAFGEENPSALVYVVRDGVEAMDFLRQGIHRPDLILLDLNMPKMDGRQVLTAIKEDENLKSIPTVILTTSDAEADIVKSYLLQANSYLCKPVEYSAFETLVKSINDYWLTKSKLAPPLQALVGAV
jgi:diguanylate cyclase (GGDEF)-like protein